ncbi:MAG: hypothetical protein U5K71_16270 [Gracilimonas sp.]|nr:hypothetical protein [Gracilimonas sp.]
MNKILSLAVLFLFGTQVVQAQSYSPDRPGIGNGSAITPENMLGVEAGFQARHTDFGRQLDVRTTVIEIWIDRRFGSKSFTEFIFIFKA